MTRARSKVRSELGEIRRVERAAAALSPLERDVLALSAGLGLSNSEIATRLGIGERRVTRLLAKALGKFDREIDGRSPRWWRFW